MTAGDVIPIRFSNTTIPPCSAEVLTVDGHFVTFRYLDGIFAGLRGLLRLPGWSQA